MQFLSLVAKDIISRLGGRISDCVVVFPNKRPVYYFLKALEQSGISAANAPAFFSIEDFINEHATGKPADPIELLFILYKVYLRHYPDTDFEAFYGWGNLMLSDFDEIDRYLADSKKLLKNISAVKDLEKNFLSDLFIPEEILMPLNPDDEHYLQNRFKETWQIYSQTYQEFKQELQKQGLAYAGMNYREVAEKLISGDIKPSAATYIFIGFNALSKSEETIIQTLISQDKALIYWDADHYFMDNEHEEGGHFIRKTMSGLKGYNPQVFTNNFLSGKKNIHIIGVPLQAGQAKTLGAELKEYLTSENIASTAIVLADEKLLVPVMYSLPEAAEGLNITSGYPLQLNSIYSLFQSLIRLSENFRADSRSFYHKDVNAILSHPLLRNRDDYGARRLAENIQLNQLIYISESLVRSYNSKILDLFFIEINDHAQTGPYFNSILTFAKNHLNTDSQREKLAIIGFEDILNELSNLVQSQKTGMGQKTYLRLFKEKIYKTRIPVSDDKPDGLQLMGMLETRCLDFETVFLISVNEGVLPAGGKSPSYIPFDLRKTYGLPTIDEQDSLYAYNFYRLLQRAKHVFLFYNSETGSGGEEKSRYLRQVEYYLPRANPDIIVTHRYYSMPLVNSPAKQIVLKKEKAWFETLAAKNETGFSPSFISAYYICPLKFLFSNILKLPEKEEVVEDLEAKHFGLLFHALMEKVFEGLKGEMVTAEILKERRARLTLDMDWVLDQIHKTQKENILQKNSLLVETVKVLAEKTIDADINYAPFTLLETEFKAGYQMPFNESGIENINLKGIIDRVDLKEGITRIVDYKTGAVKKQSFNFKDHEEGLQKENKEAFQTLFYGYLYHKAHPDVKIKAAIMPLKEVVKGYININAEDGMLGTEDFNIFEEKLKSILVAIFNPETPVIQTEDQTICAFCSYNNFCMR